MHLYMSVGMCVLDSVCMSTIQTAHTVCTRVRKHAYTHICKAHAYQVHMRHPHKMPALWTESPRSEGHQTVVGDRFKGHRSAGPIWKGVTEGMSPQS